MKRMFAESLRLLLIFTASSAYLATHLGTVHVRSAGTQVAIGAGRPEVTRQLGQPDRQLPNGAWLYRSYSTPNRTESGTLVIAFANGQVRDLSVVSPLIATMLAAAPAHALGRAGGLPWLAGSIDRSGANDLSQQPTVGFAVGR